MRRVTAALSYGLNDGKHSRLRVGSLPGFLLHSRGEGGNRRLWAAAAAYVRPAFRLATSVAVGWQDIWLPKKYGRLTYGTFKPTGLEMASVVNLAVPLASWKDPSETHPSNPSP